jgi:hypothetical protein
MFSAAGKESCPLSDRQAGSVSCWWRRGLGLSLVLLTASPAEAGEHPAKMAGALPGLVYTNSRMPDVPWSIHIVKLERANPRYQIQSAHATGGALGLDTLSDQLGVLHPALGTAVAAINGDFYQRNKTYAGAPRGLQVMGGELLSGPSGGASFWIDALGKPHTDKVESRFQIIWPDGTATAFGLNGMRRADGLELYTPAIGPSTLTAGGCELILTRAEGSPWLPLRIGRTYRARVHEIRGVGNTRLASDILVLSIGPEAFHGTMPQITPGAILQISTASWPALHGIRTAIAGGPVLVRNGKRQTTNLPDSDSYEISTMQERHPRAAVGWNERYLFLVEVDGRQRGLSVGMTLDELARFLTRLGCTEAMNFDGGGSATLWFDGQVRNNPCDRMEREIANCLVIAKTKP